MIERWTLQHLGFDDAGPARAEHAHNEQLRMSMAVASMAAGLQDA